MRLFRSSILTAAAGLALAASPALAGEAPPLQPVAGADYAVHSSAVRPDMPPQPGQPRMGYSVDERAGWLDECTHRLSGAAPRGERAHRDADVGRARGECENYLARYEAAQGGATYGQYTWSYGAGAAQAAGTPNCAAAGCGYPAAPPGMMWVPVIFSGGQNCCCAQKPKVRTIVTEEEVPERAVTYEAPPKIIHTKYTKYTKTVPVRSTKPIKPIKPIKSIKSIK